MKRKIIKDALICGLGSFVDSQYFKAAHFFAGPRDKPTQRVITQFFRKYSPPPTVHLFLFFIPIRKY